MATFLSLASAPIGARREDFYLPWTMICKKWGDMFVVEMNGKAPAMFQCTWRTEERLEERGNETVRIRMPSRFFIGVSLSCYAGPGYWVRRVREARFAQLSINGRADGMVKSYRYGASPMFNANRQMGWNFGNCAETHPFLELMQ